MSSDGDSLKEQSENDFIYYQVKSGDSLASIAAHFGYMTPSQLGRANALPCSGSSLPHVFPGQKLIIPTVSKVQIAPPRIRHAPGTALRVSSTVDSVFPAVNERQPIADFRLQNIYTIPQACQKQHTGLSEEANACQFVKIPVQCLVFKDIVSYELVDGTLIITPDRLCFDSTAEVAKTKEQAGDSGDIGAEATDRGLPTDQEHSASKSMNIILPLSEVVSMTTLKSLHEVMNQTAAGRHVSSPAGTGLDSLESPRTATRPSSTASREPTSPSSLLVADDWQLVPGECRNGGHGEAASYSPPPPSPDSNSDEVFESDSNTVRRSSAPVTSSSLRLKQVYLRLGSLSSNSGCFRDYCFVISADHIAKVHAFLLQGGVGLTRADGGAVSSQAKLRRETSKSPQPEKEEQSNRASLVEQMLQSVDESCPMPLLFDGKSVILTDDMLLDLGCNMPAHLTGCNLSLVYSTELNGYSLATLYRKSADVSRAVLLVIRDTMGTVFGAIMSERMHCSQLFYGTGETCVFHWLPDFKRYDWTKKNDYLMHGSPNGFHIGGQSGRSAIWFDEALKHGRSEPTDTFNNPVLSGCLSDFSRHPEEANAAGPEAETVAESVPFIIDSLEVWQLVS